MTWEVALQKFILWNIFRRSELSVNSVWQFIFDCMLLVILGWFDMDDQFNTKVYVSNLPLDVTEEEFLDVMRKGGVVMRDPETGKMMI